MGGKNDKKKAAPKKVLSAEEMRRMGMPEEQIQQLLASQGMSAEEKKKATADEEAKKSHAAAKAKFEKALAELLTAEATARPQVETLAEMESVELMTSQEKEWEPYQHKLDLEEKRRRLHEKAKEVKEKHDAKELALQNYLEGMTPEERAAYDAKTKEQQEKEWAQIEDKQEAILRAKEKDAHKKATEEEKRLRREAKVAEKKEYLKELEEKGIALQGAGDENNVKDYDAVDAREEAFLKSNRALV